MDINEINEINVLVLAYLGDTIYEDYIRKFLINKKIAKVNDLQKEALNYVSAKAQSSFLKKMLDEDFLTDEEERVMRRARNNKNNRHPKNTDIVTYKHATALEAIIGYHELNNNRERIDILMNYILGE